MPLLAFLSKGFFKWGAVTVILLGILWKAYDLGGDHVQAQWDLERAEVATANAQEVARLEALNNQVTRDYLALSTRLRDGTRTIIEKVPVYVTKQDDANCTIPDGFVRLHDEATGNPTLPETSTTPGTDDTPEPIELSDVGATVVGNYSQCRRTALQLEALQKWVKKIAQ